MPAADLSTPPEGNADPNEIWRRGNRVPLWRYQLEMKAINTLWFVLRRLWRGF